MIAAVLLGLTLILLTRRREFLTATETIKDPSSFTGEEVAAIMRQKAPEAFAKLEQLARSGKLGPPNAPPPSETQVPRIVNSFALEVLIGGWRDLYTPATSPLTSQGIDAWVSDRKTKDVQRSQEIGMTPPSAEYYDIFQGFLKAYFLDSAPAPVSTTASSSPIPSEPAVEGTVVTSISSLEQEYNRLRGDYEFVVNKAINTTRKNELTPLIDQILQLNTQITGVLEQLVGTLAAQEAKGTSEFTAKRNDFALRLSQIKKDYGDLKADTDKMTTLRRIRQYEESKATAGLKGYLIAFGVAVSLLIVLILFKMFQPSKNLYATNPTTTNPAISPNLET